MSVPDVPLRKELVYDRAAVSIVRLNGVPRSGVDGRHRRLVAYVAPTVTDAELIRMLREAAEQLAKALPRWSE